MRNTCTSYMTFTTNEITSVLHACSNVPVLWAWLIGAREQEKKETLKSCKPHSRIVTLSNLARDKWFIDGLLMYGCGVHYVHVMCQNWPAHQLPGEA